MKGLRYLFFGFLILWLSSCTKEITVDIPDPEFKIIVEGYIENDVPPYVILTRNSSYFGGVDLNDLASYFVRGAEVTVLSPTDSVQLVEFCVYDLPEAFQREVAAQFGFAVGDSAFIPNVCVYAVPDIFNYFLTGQADFIGKPGTNYRLRVTTENEKLTAITRIPDLIPFDYLEIRPHPDVESDSLVNVYVQFTIPDTFGNFVRYFTQRNNEPFYPPLSRSVFDDKLFVGSSFALPLERGQDPGDGIDFDTYGYFWKGDTVSVKWMNIDKATYDFWNTLESDAGDSPFSSPVIVKTNINGGLGIWGGYAATFGSIYVPL